MAKRYVANKDITCSDGIIHAGDLVPLKSHLNIASSLERGLISEARRPDIQAVAAIV